MEFMNYLCRDCAHYIENNPIKYTYPKDLCTYEKNKQSALSGQQFMQVSRDFCCIYFIEYCEID